MLTLNVKSVVVWGTNTLGEKFRADIFMPPP